MSLTGTWALAPAFACEITSDIALGNVIADPHAPDSPLQRVKPEDLTDFPTVEDVDEGSYRIESADGSPLALGLGARIFHSLTFAVWHQRPASDFANHSAVGVRTRKLAPNLPWRELRPFLERESSLAYLISGRPLYVVSGIMIATKFRRHTVRDPHRRTDLEFGFGDPSSSMHLTGSMGTSSPKIKSVNADLSNILFAYRLHKVTLGPGPQEPQIQAQVSRSLAAFASIHHDRSNNREGGQEEEGETGSGGGGGGDAICFVEMTCEDWRGHHFQILPSVREETETQIETGD
ncbi:hypothetical protein ASPACDRAFT_65009 [Aspergillus aculeatus ATCC 16872]|uniref:Uncharacterized protein n=1 Tax=Aspergillus aculeatus (strain ATCC 16872 / CBS 172.66 / WB 5094) TaxID=690307 RepID=A0A1L9WF60_ASPA1|nr:uncharacterized protein ASPACDRAFT_65009 [Aspergillus aculeatus ATCC 16872]OJJ94737.1 hypothetical protein ASPACDRAFT_65009 [Aspergillus aculeatus ATCC 16872]